MVLKDVPNNSTVVGVPGRVIVQNDIRIEELDQVHLPDPVMNDIDSLKEDNERLQKQINDILAVMDKTCTSADGKM